MEFILSSQKNPLRWGSNYQISTNQGKETETDPECQGCVQSNFSGSFWNFYETKNGKDEMIATVTYNRDLSICSNNPREIQIYLISPFYQYLDL